MKEEFAWYSENVMYVSLKAAEKNLASLDEDSKRFNVGFYWGDDRWKYHGPYVTELEARTAYTRYWEENGHRIREEARKFEIWFAKAIRESMASSK
jgi:hypothetical protein